MVYKILFDKWKCVFGCKKRDACKIARIPKYWIIRDYLPNDHHVHSLHAPVPGAA